MKVLFLGLNYAPEMVGIAVYSSGLCEDLAAAGHDVRAITGHPYYPAWKVSEGFGGGWRHTVEQGVTLTRCPLYVPAHPSGAKRLVHHLSFALSAFPPMISAALRFKPDIVVTVAPSLMAAPVAWLAARLAGAPAWLHVQDFEVEAAFATDLLDAHSRTARIARSVERWIMRRFDRLTSISPEMRAKLNAFAPEERTGEFRNWADVDRIKPLPGASPYRAEWGISSEHVALYSGNIANKQGIEIVLDAARLLRDRKDLTFVVCGQGPNRGSLEAQASDLPNLRFHDLQPTERLGDLLGLATVHLLPQKAGAADLVLPSKLTNMLASGKPVVATAAMGTGLAREVDGCGLLTPPGDSRAFAEAITRLIDNPPMRVELGRAARARAERVWSRPQIVAKALDAMRALVQARKAA